MAKLHKQPLRMARTPVAHAQHERLKKVDSRAARKIEMVIAEIKVRKRRGHTVGELAEVPDERVRRLAKVLKSEGISEEAKVHTTDISNSEHQAPSIVFVIEEQVPQPSTFDRAIVFEGLLLEGKKLLDLKIY